VEAAPAAAAVEEALTAAGIDDLGGAGGGWEKHREIRAREETQIF
jgi:hypothetical protein